MLAIVVGLVVLVGVLLAVRSWLAPAPGPAPVPTPAIELPIVSPLATESELSIVSPLATETEASLPSESPVVVTPDVRAPVGGTVRLSSRPDGAAIIVDGEPAGRTPRLLNLQPGTYEVVLVSQSYQDWTEHVEVLEGQEVAVSAELVVLPTIDTLDVSDVRLGRDPYVDTRGLIRVGTVADTFTVADDVNAIVYFRPKSYGIRDLTFKTLSRWQRAGTTPIELEGDHRVPREWEETFVRACAPAIAIDARGSNTPLTLEISIEGQVVGRFTFRIQPGNVGAASPSPCDTSAAPGAITLEPISASGRV